MLDKMKNHRGATLLEIIIALAIVGLLVALAFNLLFFGNEIFAKGSDQYQVQTSVRLSTTGITEAVRFASVVSIETSKPVTFEDPYHYIYYENESVYYSYLDADDNRQTRLLGVEVKDLSFTKASPNLLNLSIRGLEEDQAYSIDMDVGLPNMSIKNNEILGETSGTALKLLKDSSVTNLSASDEVRLNREINFGMIQGEEFLFIANKAVDWSVYMGVGFQIIDSDDRIALVRATGDIGHSATIRATSVEDNTQWRQVTVTVVSETSVAKIVRSDDSVITGSVNLSVGTDEVLKVIIEPSLPEGVNVASISWTSPIEGETAFITFEEDEDNPNTVLVQGINPGGSANLTVSVALDDDEDNPTVLTDSVIINVTAITEYARLLSLSFEGNTTLSPNFDPDIVTYSVSGNGSQGLVITKPLGAVVVVDPVESKYNLSQSIDITITVSEEGKLTRTYRVTN